MQRPAEAAQRAAICRQCKLRGIVVLLALLSIGSGGAATAQAMRGRRLVDVLAELQTRGLNVVFSSATVGPDVLVTVEPDESSPRLLLDEILDPLGLLATDGPAGSVAILPKPTTCLLRGVVLNRDKRPVIAATVRLNQDPPVHTDQLGRFERRDLQLGSLELRIDAHGYLPATFPVVLDRPQLEQIFVLAPQPTFITEVVVTPSHHTFRRPSQSDSDSSRLASPYSLSPTEIAVAPTLASDALRVVELLPGVSARDNSSQLFIRGASSQSVAIVLDGLELYHPYHLAALQSPFSVVDSNLVQRIDYTGGGFTAEQGDRQGLIDIETIDDVPRRYTEVEIGTLLSRVTVGLPGSAGSWLISARGWYPEAFRDTTELGQGEPIAPLLGDLYGKLALRLSDRHSLSIHGLAALDSLRFTERNETVNEQLEIRTRNVNVWLRVRSDWSDRLSSQTILSSGRVVRERDGVAAEDGPVVIDDDRKVDFVGMTHTSTVLLSDRQAMKAGVDLRWLEGDYRYAATRSLGPNASPTVVLDPDGSSLGLFLSHRIQVSKRLTAEIGARWDRDSLTDDSHVSPRVNALYWLTERTTLRLALARLKQSMRVHELSVEDGDTQFQPAERARQVELSLQHRFGSGIGLRVDAYHRKITSVSEHWENLFEPIDLFPETTKDRVLIAPDRAVLRGVELRVDGDAARAVVWSASYALSSAADLVADRPIPRSWDQTHAAKFLLGYRTVNWTLAVSGNVHTGWPTTPVVGVNVATADGTTQFDAAPGPRNSDRLPPYARLDLSARRMFSLRQYGRLWLGVEIANVTNRANACCINEFVFARNPDGSIGVERDFDYWLGLTPSANLRWTW